MLALIVLVFLVSRAQAGADLVIDRDRLANSLSTDTIRSDDPCLVDEGCLSGPSVNALVEGDLIEGPPVRKLVRFTTAIWNIGDEDLVVGSPPPNRDDPHEPWWEYAECHGHWHLVGLAKHDILLPDTKECVKGFEGVGILHSGEPAPGTETSKTGFCMRDNICRNGGRAKFDCENQGITAQCADVYGAELPCQWVDVTDLAPGRYILRVTSNFDRRLVETNYTNNVVEVEFHTDDLSRFISPQEVTLVAVAFIVFAFIYVCARWNFLMRRRPSTTSAARIE